MMYIKKFTLILSIIIFITLSFTALAAIDSTNPEIVQFYFPGSPRAQCFTVKADNKILRLTPQTITADTTLTNCTWRGMNDASWWAAGITNATYYEGCQGNEVATGVKHGIRGAFGYAGVYDLYVLCCTVEVKLTMSQIWTSCP